MLAGTALAVVLAGCSGVASPDRIPPAKVSASPSAPPSGQPGGTDTTTPTPTRTPTPTHTPTPDPATIGISPKSGADVGPTNPITVHAKGGTLTSVAVVSAGGSSISGAFNHGKTRWTSVSSATLTTGTTYTVQAKATNAAGNTTKSTEQFSTKNQQVLGTYITPDGQTVGVGMPLVVKFTAPVTNRKAVQKNLKVTTSKHVVGVWHWFSATEVHFRPKTYWPGNMTVKLALNLRGVSGGKNLTGITNKVKTFQTGNSHLITVNLKTDELRAYQNGRLLHTIPVSGGKAGWETRSGTKVVLEKDTNFNMTSESIGVTGGKKNPNYYSVWVKWALRITWSGEFLHSNTWSVWAFGHENTSHGCVGMTESNADWLYHWAMIGDPVQTTGSNTWMPVTGNGYGDWNMSWSQWKAGSAL